MIQYVLNLAEDLNMAAKNKIVIPIGLIIIGATVFALTYRPWSSSTELSDEEKVAARANEISGQGQLPPRVDLREQPDPDKVAPAPATAADSTTTPTEIQKEKITRGHREHGQRSKRALRDKSAGSEDPASGVMARFQATPKEEAEPEPAAKPLPETHGRGEITKVMGSIHRSIQRCYDTGMVPGRVALTLTIAGQTGKVVKTDVSEESSTAVCIQRLAQNLQFPRFARDQVTVSYPYSFR
jgi:hypothetical protein